MSTSVPYIQANFLSPLDCSSKNLDHLGIVATVCKEIGLADEIDGIVGVDPRQKVTCGEVVELLINEGLKPEEFNDDVLRRTFLWSCLTTYRSLSRH